MMAGNFELLNFLARDVAPLLVVLVITGIVLIWLMACGPASR